MLKWIKAKQIQLKSCTILHKWLTFVKKQGRKGSSSMRHKAIGDMSCALTWSPIGAVPVDGLNSALNPGPVFTKGLRLSQVLGLNPVLQLRLLSQLSFVLKPCSQRVT